MPKGDGTGPEGKGPKTGRGLGKASGNTSGQNVGQPRKEHNNENRPAKGSGLGRNKNK